MSKEKTLSAKEALFVAEFSQSGDKIAAYRHAFSAQRLGKPVTEDRATKLLNRPHVRAAVEASKRVLGEKMVFDIKDVMLEWMDIATTDVNELVSLRKNCCRYCYGIGHEYQWTEREYSQACFDALDWNAQNDTQRPIPDAKGGFDFNFTLPPVADCPECRGEGVEHIQYHDTTKLSRKARKLYAGIKQTKFGIEVLLRDQDAALANIAKALGMFVERVKLDATIQAKLNKPLPSDPVEATRAYMELLESE